MSNRGEFGSLGWSAGATHFLGFPLLEEARRAPTPGNIQSLGKTAQHLPPPLPLPTSEGRLDAPTSDPSD